MNEGNVVDVIFCSFDFWRYGYLEEYYPFGDVHYFGP